MHRIKYPFALAALLLLFASPAVSQRALEKFGRNRVQYEQFDWQYYSAVNFDVYFYKGGDKVAKEIIQYLEGEFDRITDLIGYPPYTKTKIFLYNSVADLQQSNMGINDTNMEIGGETQFVKSYIEVAHSGNAAALKDELLYKVTSLMVNEMMFGGSLKDMFENSVLLNLPAWFIEGASLYVAKGWSADMDDYVRELVNTKKPTKLNKLHGRNAALAGQSLWNYIAEKYGKSNVSNILNYTRIIRNEEKSITITLGVSYDRLLKNWLDFYTLVDNQVKESYVTPSTDTQVDLKGKHIDNYHVKLSPNSTKLAYTENNNGRYRVMLKDLLTGAEHEVLSGGYKVIEQEVDYNMPLIDWADENTLGIIHNKSGKIVFTIYDLITNSKLPRDLRRFDQVKSMAFSGNGRLFVISAVTAGRNDLFLLSTRRDRAKQLTDDIYDDLDPAFVPNTNTVIFSSNRTTDTLKRRDYNFGLLGERFNLYAYNLDTTKNILYRVTKTVSNDSKPLVMDQGKVYYLSDQKGITNIFSYNMTTGIYTQITNFSRGIKDYDIDFVNSSLAMIMSEKDGNTMYVIDDFDINQQIFTPQTLRKQSQQVKAYRVKKREEEENKELTLQQIVEQRLVEAEKLRLDTVDNDDGIIDTDNYTFDEEVLEEEQNKELFITKYRKQTKENIIKGPYPYDSRMSADNILTSFVIDPLRGFGVQLEIGVNDMLENHKFIGGIMTTTNLRSGNLFAEYNYLKTQVDYSLRYERDVILWEASVSQPQQPLISQRYIRNTFEAGASFPFNTKTRISLKPFYTQTRYEDLGEEKNSAGVFKPIETSHYLGARLELVYDNSIVNGMNLIEGSRAKIKLTHHEGIADKNITFSNFSVDLRHYQKISREIVFATRFYYGSFFGNSPKKYLLGGMDNWLFSKQNSAGDGNPLKPVSNKDNSELLFMEYSTSLRGFDYATLLGNNTLLFNAELRVPIIRYFSSGPISSNFLRNLQFTGFFDMGSAWSGISPFKEGNTVGTKVIPEDEDQRQNSNFFIKVNSYINPWLYSYGAGLRTMLLGYYVKFDVAWPVENYEVNDPRLSVTLGYDF